MIRGTALVLLFALLIFIPWYFLKNPFDAVYCLMLGNEWAGQGRNGRYCKEFFGDGGSLCSKNRDCKSKKCVIGYQGKISGVNVHIGAAVSGEEISLGVFKDIVDEDIRGKCSATNQATCYSGEMTVDDNRVVVTPSTCN